MGLRCGKTRDQEKLYLLLEHGPLWFKVNTVDRAYAVAYKTVECKIDLYSYHKVKELHSYKFFDTDYDIEN